MTALLCPRCEQPLDSGACECRALSRRKFFAGFGIALAGAVVAPNYVLGELSKPRSIIGPYGNIVHTFPTLSPLLSSLARDDSPRSLFAQSKKRFSGEAVFWDVKLDYRAPPRGSFATFERFVEKHYAVS